MGSFRRARLFSHAISLLIIGQLLFLGLDAVGNDMKSREMFRILSSSLIAPVLIAQMILNTMGAHRQPTRLIRFLSWVILPELLLGTIILTLADSATYTNASYTLTHIHQSKLGLMTLFLAASLIISDSNRWTKHQWTRFVTFLPYYVFFMLFLMQLWPFDFFNNMGGEAGPIENLQFIVLILGSFWCARWAVKYKSILLTICSIGFFLIAGDEVAWGQKFFHLALPSYFAANNSQQEITAHNLRSVVWSVQWIYLFIAFAGLCGRQIAQRFSGTIKKLQSWFPTTSFAGYFVFPLVFYTVQQIVAGGIWHNWAEPMELFLYTGVVIWICLRLWKRS